MKTNGKKAIIATMAIAMAAGIAGSISGTVAWFQYNTRVTSEFEGTTAKCTEFLQVRTVKKGLEVTQKVANKAALPTSAVPVGAVYITDDGKIFKNTAAVAGTPAWDEEDGTDLVNGAVYHDASKVYTWKVGSPSTFVEEDIDAAFGEWKTTLLNADILAAAGRADNKLSPVTLPGTESASVEANLASATKFYGAPIAGYELYDESLPSKPYHWQDADPADYMKFDLQFRVLDVDGTEATADDPAMFAQDLFLTNLTVKNSSTSPIEDITSATRLLIEEATSGTKLLVAPDSAHPAVSTVDTVTEGKLDLDLDGDLDNTLDIPGGNYSFNTAGPTDLVYGDDKGIQKSYNSLYSGTDGAGIYPKNDGTGVLTLGKSLGKTIANTSGETVSGYLTLSFTFFLEGWQDLPNSNAKDTDATTPRKKIWDSAKYIGSEFDVGMSFGVTRLD